MVGMVHRFADTARKMHVGCGNYNFVFLTFYAHYPVQGVIRVFFRFLMPGELQKLIAVGGQELAAESHVTCRIVVCRSVACRTNMFMGGSGARQSLPTAFVKHDTARGALCWLLRLDSRLIRIMHNFVNLTITMMVAVGSGFLFAHGDAACYSLL
jgi:hypothetical protein